MCAADEFGLTPYERQEKQFRDGAPRYDPDLDRPGDTRRPTYGEREVETPQRTPDPLSNPGYERDMRNLFTQPSLRKHCDAPSRPSSLDKHCGGPY